MPLGFWLGWSRVIKGAKGLNIFPRAKDPDPLFFFVHEPFRDPPSIPPLLNIVPFVSPVSSTDQTSSFSRLLCPPSYHPPILLSSCAPSSSLYYSFIPAHHLYLVSTSRATFSLFDNGKNLGRGEREKGARKLTRGAVSLDAFSSGFHRRAKRSSRLPFNR